VRSWPAGRRIFSEHIWRKWKLWHNHPTAGWVIYSL
jgi:hypothetical protein